MKFLTRLIEPSYLRSPTFDSVERTDETFHFNCDSCGQSVSIVYSSLLGKEWGWWETYTKVELKEIEEHFGMNMIGKTPDGSWTAIESINCTNCSAKYLLYAGINEYANGVYKATLQGLSRLENE